MKAITDDADTFKSALSTAILKQEGELAKATVTGVSATVGKGNVLKLQIEAYESHESVKRRNPFLRFV